MLKKSCWKVVTKPWIDGFMDWIEWPAQQMTEEAKVWIDHHRRSIIEHWLTLFLHEFLISSLDTINYSTWWSTGPDDKSYSELDCYLHLFYDTHLSSASLDSIVMKKRLPSKFLGKTQFNLLPFKKHFAPSKSPLLKIGYCTITNLEQQRWSKLMHIFLPGVIPIPPKCKTRKRGGDKSSSHLHHFLSSSISSLSWGYLKTPFAT